MPSSRPSPPSGNADAAAAPSAAVAAPARDLRVLVVDDDPLARGRLLEFLTNARGVHVVGSCTDGAGAVAAIRREAPDAVFLDVQMPTLDGFGVVEAVGVAQMPAVVFTSAYAEYAVRAFEAYAVDYVLKPFDDARLGVALERVRRHAAERAATAGGLAPDARLAGLLDDVRRPGAPRYPEALAVRAGRHYVVVRTADIDWIEADGNYARLHAGRTPRVITRSLANLEQEVLNPDRFVRVHRSAIVQLARIATVEPHAHGELTIVLHDGTRVECSRRYRHLLEARMHFMT